MANLKPINNKLALDFMTAGKSSFTLKSEESGKEFAFSLKKRKTDSGDVMYFASILSSDNASYAGVIFFNDDINKWEFAKGKKGSLDKEDTRVKSLVYTLNTLQKSKFNNRVEVYHHGKCGKCGKKLTNTASIESGFGPECRKTISI